MTVTPKVLIAVAAVVVAVLVGVGFHLLDPADDGSPAVDASARSAALRAEAARDRQVDRVLAAAPVIGGALATDARVINRTAWYDDAAADPIGEVVLITFLTPVDLPASYRTPADPSGDGATASRGGRIPTQPLAAADRAGVDQLVALVDVERHQVYAVSPVSAAASATTTTTGG